MITDPHAIARLKGGVERPPSLARGEGSREAPGAEGREAAWSSRLRVPQEELAALPGKLHGEEQEKEHLLLQLHGQPSPFLRSDVKQKQYDYTAQGRRCRMGYSPGLA